MDVAEIEKYVKNPDFSKKKDENIKFLAKILRENQFVLLK